jgi:hypothetical protein
VVEHLLGKHKALNSKPSPTKKKKKSDKAILKPHKFNPSLLGSEYISHAMRSQESEPVTGALLTQLLPQLDSCPLHCITPV